MGDEYATQSMRMDLRAAQNQIDSLRADLARVEKERDDLAAYQNEHRDCVARAGVALIEAKAQAGRAEADLVEANHLHSRLLEEHERAEAGAAVLRAELIRLFEYDEGRVDPWCQKCAGPHATTDERCPIVRVLRTDAGARVLAELVVLRRVVEAAADHMTASSIRADDTEMQRDARSTLDRALGAWAALDGKPLRAEERDPHAGAGLTDAEKRALQKAATHILETLQVYAGSDFTRKKP